MHDVEHTYTSSKKRSRREMSNWVTECSTHFQQTVSRRLRLRLMPYYGWRSLYVVEPWSAEVSGEVHAYCYNRRSLLVIYSTDIVWQHYQLIEPWIQA